MSFKEVLDLDCDATTAIGGRNKKTGKTNPNQIEGYFIGTKQTPNKLSKSGFSCLHIFQTEAGRVGVWGKTDLDRKMKAVVAGAMTRISANGTIPTKFGDMAKFKVEVDASNSIEVDSSLLANNSADSSSEEYPASDESVDAEEEPVDEVPPPRATKPVRAAETPSAERQAKVQALLNAGRTRA